MERSNNRFAREGCDAACETFARARHTPRQSRAHYRSETQALFPACIHSAARCRPPSADHPIASRFTAQSSRVGGRPVTHVPHCSRGRNLSKVSWAHLSSSAGAGRLTVVLDDNGSGHSTVNRQARLLSNARRSDGGFQGAVVIEK